MPKQKLSAALYGLIAVVSLAAAVPTFRGRSVYAGADRPFLLGMALMFLLTGVLFGIGAVTRRGLISDDGPRICRSGWILVIAFVVVVPCVLSFLYDTGDVSPVSTVAVAFVPPWIKRLQEKYYEGVEEAERALNPGGPGGEPRSGS